MKSKIVIDGLTLLGNLSGIGRYTYEVSKYLSKKSKYKLNYFYGFFSYELIAPKTRPKTKILRNLIIRNKFVKGFCRQILFYVSNLVSSKYDLYWQPNFIPLKNIKTKKIVVTVHDFAWERYPEFHPDERIAYFKNNFYQNLQMVDHVITVSHFVKNEILLYAGLESNDITVIYNGIDHNLFFPAISSNLNKQQYILAVGSIEPRKNLKNLLIAYSQFSQSFKDQYHLLLIGDQGWKNGEIMSLIKDMKQWVHYTGYISDERLANYYQHASLFVYPSFYEGFGIPPLEAMACGTAVVTSNTSALPEVCSDAAIYCDPNDVNDIKEKIELVLNDTILQQVLITKGLERAKMFSWNKSAKEHLEVFEKVLYS